MREIVRGHEGFLRYLALREGRAVNSGVLWVTGTHYDVFGWESPKFAKPEAAAAIKGPSTPPPRHRRHRRRPRRHQPSRVRASTDERPSVESLDSAHRQAMSGGSVLILDDDDDLRAALGETLEAIFGRPWLGAGSVDELRALEASLSACDLAILDINLAAESRTGSTRSTG